MPASTRTTREAWIEAGLSALADGGAAAGPDGRPAPELGGAPGSVCDQLESRPAFLDALLDTWEHRSTEDVRQRVEREGGDARRKVARAGMLTFSDELLPMDLAVRDWARRDDAVATRLRRVDNQRMHYLRDLISAFCTDPDEVEARGMLAFALAIGNNFVAAEHLGSSRAEVLKRATQLLLG